MKTMIRYYILQHLIYWVYTHFGMLGINGSIFAYHFEIPVSTENLFTEIYVCQKILLIRTCFLGNIIAGLEKLTHLT